MSEPEVVLKEVIPYDPKSNFVVVFEAAADAAVQFQVCNTIMAAPEPWSMFMTSGIGLLCVTTRVSGELQAQGRETPFPEVFDRFSRNLGAPLIVNGALLAAATVPKAMDTGMEMSFAADWNQPFNANGATILLTFAAGNAARGIARGIKDKFGQAVLDAIGTTGAVIGVMASVPDSHIAIKATLLTAWAVEVLKSAKVLKVPMGTAEVFLVGATIANSAQAFSSGDMKMGWFNVFAAAALGSLGMLKNSHGVLRFITGKGPRKPVHVMDLEGVSL